MFFLINI